MFCYIYEHAPPLEPGGRMTTPHNASATTQSDENQAQLFHFISWCGNPKPFSGAAGIWHLGPPRPICVYMYIYVHAHTHMYVCVYVLCVCVCVCVYVSYTFHIHTCMYMHVWICVCLCVCACIYVCVRMCVCVCVCVLPFRRAWYHAFQAGEPQQPLDLFVWR